MFISQAVVTVFNGAFQLQSEYAADHPRGINPVQLNDVIFTLHAVVITVVTIFQCFIYEVNHTFNTISGIHELLI